MPRENNTRQRQPQFHGREAAASELVDRGKVLFLLVIAPHVGQRPRCGGQLSRYGPEEAVAPDEAVVDDVQTEVVCTHCPPEYQAPLSVLVESGTETEKGKSDTKLWEV